MSVFSGIISFPHSLAYFNFLAGGPSNGWRHLAHSNVDWGQGLLYLGKWQAAHPEASRLTLVPFVPEKYAPPACFGVTGDVIDPQEGLPSPLPAGWYAISGSRLSEPAMAPFRRIRRVALIANCLHIFHLTGPS
jgi:hypothetical protein